MPVRLRPLVPSAVGGGGAFSAVLAQSVRERRGRTCRKVISFSSAGKGGDEAARRETPEETRKRLEELDALLEGLVEPKMRPPTPPPPPGNPNSRLCLPISAFACSVYLSIPLIFQFEIENFLAYLIQCQQLMLSGTSLLLN